VAQWYIVYELVARLLQGFIAFGLDMIAHFTTGFSSGGVVILVVITCSCYARCNSRLNTTLHPVRPIADE
jgi:hypothetical protein